MREFFYKSIHYSSLENSLNLNTRELTLLAKNPLRKGSIMRNFKFFCVMVIVGLLATAYVINNIKKSVTFWWHWRKKGGRNAV